MWLIDKAGRKTLLLIGSFGYILSLGAIAWSFANDANGILIVIFIFVFIASHAIGQGTVIWVFIAEIFPNSVRTKGQSLGSGTHWILAALITLFMPHILSNYKGEVIFIFFALMMFLQLLFVLLVMPETKGKTLESIGEESNEKI